MRERIIIILDSNKNRKNSKLVGGMDDEGSDEADSDERKDLQE
jgi:hypothetical protein